MKKHPNKHHHGHPRHVTSLAFSRVGLTSPAMTPNTATSVSKADAAASASGSPDRVIVCVLGFVPLLMAVTGAAIWWPKPRGSAASSRPAIARHPLHARIQPL